MNIVMFVDRFYPKIGGVEKHTLKICENLIERGFNITVFTRNDDEFSKNEIYKGIKIIRLASYNRFNRISLFCQILLKIKIIFKANLVHFHDFSTFYYWYLPFKFILPFKKNYVTFHGWEGDIPPRKNIKKKRKIVEILTNGNICVGDFISKWYATKPTITTYGGVDKVKENDIPEKDDALLYLGRLEKDTGILFYLEVIKELKEVYNLQSKLIICGDGTLKYEILSYLDKYNIEYDFKGFVNNPDEYIKKSKYCFTSGYLGILEAMSNKSLVVSVFDNDLKKDYLKLMPISDSMIIGDTPSKVAEKINKMEKNNDKYNDICKKSYIWSQKQSWDKMVENYIELWNL